MLKFRGARKSSRVPPILLACQFGHAKIVQFFLDQRASFSGDSLEGQNSLQDLFYNQQVNETIYHTECQSGNLDLVLHLMIQDSVGLNYQNIDGSTALHIACAYGHTEVVNLLLQSGFMIHKQNLRNETLLHSACKLTNDNVKTVALLHLQSKQLKLDLNQQNISGWTALHYACFAGNLEIVKYMMNKSEEFLLNGLTKNGENALHLASGNGHVDIVKLILKHPEMGLDINQKDFGGNTPLHVACYSLNYDLVQFLLSHAEKQYIDVLAVNNYGETILHAALKNDGCLKMVRLLLDYAKQIGLDVNHEDSDGNTALKLALDKICFGHGHRNFHDEWCEIASHLEKFE